MLKFTIDKCIKMLHGAFITAYHNIRTVWRLMY